ncbi:MAG: hypothetical protein OIN86_11285 [Candidatus Methanoperedens sp.]|nr:hypothetical protein [Candidatus Methanoperedens sp.]CAG1009795.1 hypothetical protein METP1_03776 [Methanosarcinales archaeon]
MIKYGVIVLGLILIISLVGVSTALAESERMLNESEQALGFSKIYVEGFGANSEGFKLILRTYEQRLDTRFKPFLIDIEYILMKEESVIYSKRIKQIPLSIGGEGETVLSHQPDVALEEGNNYTGIVKIYLYNKGAPEYYLTTISNFIAKSNADITDVFSDDIGASATIKSISMVPLNAKIIFTLKQDNRIIETRETKAPSIMSNDKEKTVNVLWTNRLEEGVYVTSVLLKGTDIPVNYDKIFTVEKNTQMTSPVPVTPIGSNSHSLPGFSSGLAAIAIFALAYRWRN